MADSDAMYLKLDHHEGTITTSKHEDVKFWEGDPDEIVECESPSDVKNTLDEYDLYALNHRGKSGDQRGQVSSGAIYRTMAK